MLQSAHFLYRVELGESDPADEDRLRYTAHEMAGRLSFLLWNGPPDDTLLDAADRGELLDDESLYDHAQRLLESPTARQAVQAFFAQYFDLGRLDQVERDVERYPNFTPTLASSSRTELELLVDDFVFGRNVDIRGLFSADRTFVNRELATHYGVDAPGATPIAFVPVQLPEESHRRGILTLGAFLMMNAHPTETSPTLRGKYVRERVLCQSVPAPPGDIDLNLGMMGSEPRTLRERLEEHRQNPACAGCHAFIDPPGFLFENYDSIGAYRTHEGEFPIDASGGLDDMELTDGVDLAHALSRDPRVGECMTRQLYRHAHGRLETEGEQGAIRALTQRFAAAGYRFQDLLIELVLSESFRYLATNEEGT